MYFVDRIVHFIHSFLGLNKQLEQCKDFVLVGGALVRIEMFGDLIDVDADPIKHVVALYECFFKLFQVSVYDLLLDTFVQYPCSEIRRLGTVDGLVVIGHHSVVLRPGKVHFSTVG